MFLRLLRVVGEHALVEVLDRRQRRAVAEQHVEEFEPIDVAPEHDEADGERGREQEAHRSPEPGPEQGRDQHRERRDARRVSVDQRLDDLPDDGLDEGEEQEGRQHHAPARIDRRRKRDRQDRREEGADIGHEAHDEGEDAPQHGARHADDPEPDADDDAEGRVEGELAQEVAREPPGRVVHRHGGAVEVARTGEPDQAVAQILPLHQDEQEHDEDDAGGGKRLRHRRQHGGGEFERARAALLHLDQQRLRRLRLGLAVTIAGGLLLGLLGRFLALLAALVDRPVDVGDVVHRLAERAGPQPLDLALDGALVARHVLREFGDLHADDGGHRSDDPGGEQHRDQHREGPPQLQPAQEVHQRAEHEG